MLMVYFLQYFFKDDVPPRYADAGVRHPRARLDYDIGGGSSQYGDTYGDRFVILSKLCYF